MHNMKDDGPSFFSRTLQRFKFRRRKKSLRQQQPDPMIGYGRYFHHPNLPRNPVLPPPPSEPPPVLKPQGRDLRRNRRQLPPRPNAAPPPLPDDGWDEPGTSNGRVGPSLVGYDPLADWYRTAPPTRYPPQWEDKKSKTKPKKRKKNEGRGKFPNPSNGVRHYTPKLYRELPPVPYRAQDYEAPPPDEKKINEFQNEVKNRDQGMSYWQFVMDSKDMMTKLPKGRKNKQNEMQDWKVNAAQSAPDPYMINHTMPDDQSNFDMDFGLFEPQNYPSDRRWTTKL